MSLQTRSRPIRTLLVANRGEIALRVMRTARALGITTVALFTDADVAVPHVRDADRAVEVPSYLDVSAVVAAAVAVGADAVHPGYGFLSERAELAEALEVAGVRLVGPTAAVMRQMARKDAARDLALEAGVPVVPRGEDAGFPMMVKAAAGGGGKGMRLVRRAEDLAAALAAARREAAAAFGDDAMLVEKYVESGRHVEVQVMGDEHGTVLHLGERDCSTQRRHQKVLEEAPAPTLDAPTRTAIRAAAVALAAHVGYTGAGTVEFLLDNATGEFYFLEMNTRLQVEHPVTEAVTGLDLVALQLRVAAGEPLGLTQDDVVLSGHAIEARVYAEDAFGGFLPQAGTASFVRWPAAPSGPGSSTVRVDQALESGQVVSTSFDPMLGKVIGYGADREAARWALVAALDQTVILGLTTNVGFLRALLESEEFRAATLDTAWLDTATVPAPDPEQALLLAAWTDAHRGSAAGGPDAFRLDGWRIGGTRTPWRVQLDDETVLVKAATLQHKDRRLPVRLVTHCLSGARREVHDVVLQLGSQRVAGTVVLHADAVEVVQHGQRHLLNRPVAAGQGQTATGDGALRAPMPGTVLQVHCQEGETVTEGQVLAVLEAMKMEMSVRAPFGGVVTRVAATAGAQVQLGALLLQVDHASEVPAPEEAT